MAEISPMSACAGQTTIDPQVLSGGRHWRRNRDAARVLAAIRETPEPQHVEDLQARTGIRSEDRVDRALEFLLYEICAVDGGVLGPYSRGFRAWCNRCDDWCGPARGYERFKAERDATRHAAGLGPDRQTLAVNAWIRDIKEARGR